MTHTFNDLNLNFFKHPFTDDVVRRYDVDAIKSAVRHILLTERGEKLFKPDFGANLKRILFEPMTPMLRLTVKKKITEIIQRWEPRVIVVGVDMNMQPELNLLELTVTVQVKIDPSLLIQIPVKIKG